MNERAIRIVHGVLFFCTFVVGIVTLGISGSLVGYYNKNGYPPVHNAGYRDRIRIVLVASVWTCIFTLIVGIGFQVAGHSLIFGILTNMIPLVIAFLLYIIGVGALTGLISKVSCDIEDQTFAKCGSVWALMGAGWAETILVFLTLIFVIVIAFKARAWGGVTRQTMYVE